MNVAIQNEIKSTRRSILDTISSVTVKINSAISSPKTRRAKAQKSVTVKPALPPEFEVQMVYTNSWVEYPSCNIKGRLCAFNDNDLDMTVVNIRFKDGGYIAPHSHDRVERVFVLDGEYVDTVSGKTFKRGDVQEIAPNQLHSNKSDYALLVISWQPAYEE